MQEQEVEVLFCELCGTSVPEGDLEAGKAVRHEGKTVGSCCLAALRAAAPAAPAASAPVSKPAADGSGDSRGDGGRLLTVAVVLLAALAGGVIFLDSRLSKLEDAAAKARTDQSERQKADSELLMGIELKVADAATRAELEAVAARQGQLGEGLEGARAATEALRASVQDDLNGLRGELRTTAGQIVDYRPLFEDLRQRQMRALDVIEGMRRDAAAMPASVVEPAEPVEAGPGAPASDLPEDLAAEVAKLTSADPAVRFEAVDILVESKNPKVLPHVAPLAQDPDAYVRRLTVDGLRAFRDARAVDALIVALGDEDESVSDTAWRSLRELTGQNFSFDSTASKEARGRAAKRWQDWWAGARDTFGS